MRIRILAILITSSDDFFCVLHLKLINICRSHCIKITKAMMMNWTTTLISRLKLSSAEIKMLPPLVLSYIHSLQLLLVDMAMR